jgi:hypothetical protein
MSMPLGPIDICCDAPPYPIVRACGRLGFTTPEDVRWQRLDRPFDGPAGWRELLKGPTLTALLGRAAGRDETCACGQPPPALESYTFVLASGKEVCCLLGQCQRCRTICWAEA